MNSRFHNFFKRIIRSQHTTPARARKTLLIAVSDDRFFMSHRLEIGRAAVRKGWKVIVAAGENGCRDQILAQGMEYKALPAPGQCCSPFAALRTITILLGILLRNPNCLLHLVGLHMMLLGNIAARLTGHAGGILNAVSGLGISFQNTESRKARMVAKALRYLWPRRSPHATIFQNHEDEAILRGYGVLDAKEDVEYIKGSGVDLSQFAFRPFAKSQSGDRLRVIFSGRMLRSKGVTDLIEAAEILRAKWGEKAEFMFCGATHTNPDSLKEEEIKSLCDDQYIRWMGHREDMPQLLASARIMAFPSYYREGLPKSLIEASAVGLPIITCDSVGCRDTIDGNGVLVQPRNPRQLADEIDRLLTDDELCRRMGLRSRILAERDYDLKMVVRRHLDIYHGLFAKCATLGVTVTSPALQQEKLTPVFQPASA